jgi:hypothetical protein
MNIAVRVSLVATDWDTGGGRLETILDQYSLRNASAPPMGDTQNEGSLIIARRGARCQSLNPNVHKADRASREGIFAVAATLRALNLFDLWLLEARGGPVWTRRFSLQLTTAPAPRLAGPFHR